MALLRVHMKNRKSVQCFVIPKVNHHVKVGVRVRLELGLGLVTFQTSDPLDQ